MAEVVVRGLGELRRTLNGLEDEIRREIALDGLRAGGAIMRDEISKQAPRGSGKLKRRIIIDDDFKRTRSLGRFRTTRRGRTLAGLGKIDDPAVAVGPSQFAFWGQFVEFGWKTKGGKRVRPNRFMQRAFDRKHRATAREAQRVIGRGVEAYVRAKAVV